MRRTALTALLVLSAFDGFAARPTVEADQRAAEFLRAADRLALQGQHDDAIEKYRAVVRLYPQAIDAPKAQLKVADLLSANREHVSAFEAYQTLIDRFPASSLFLPALEGQFAIVRRISDAYRQADQRGAKPARSLPDREAHARMLRQILQNGRHAAFSPKLQYEVAVALDRSGQPKDAVGEFWKFLGTYPEDTLADDAAFQIGFVEYRLARQYNRERSARERAVAAFEYFLSHYPGSDKVPEAAHLLTVLKSWDVRGLQETAELYQRTGQKEPALRTYGEALRSAEDPAQAARIRQQMERLQQR